MHMEPYYIINHLGKVIKLYEYFKYSDDANYNSGNYFLSEDDANNKAKEILNLFKN